jgi:hypothetical protein
MPLTGVRGAGPYQIAGMAESPVTRVAPAITRSSATTA